MANERKITEKRYYTNADRTKLVPEGSEDAAFLVAGVGAVVTPEMEEMGVKGVAEEEPPRVAPDTGTVIVTGAAADAEPKLITGASLAADPPAVQRAEEAPAKRARQKGGRK